MQTETLVVQTSLRDVRAYLEQRILDLEAAGIARERICIDPGIGFGKTVGQNVDLLRYLGQLKSLRKTYPAGVSANQFLERLLDGMLTKGGCGLCCSLCWFYSMGQTHCACMTSPLLTMSCK